MHFNMTGRYSRIQNIRDFSRFFEGWKRINMRCVLTHSAQTGFTRLLLQMSFTLFAIQKHRFSCFLTTPNRYFVFIISNAITYYPSINQPINKLWEQWKIQSYFYLDNFNFIKSCVCKRFPCLASSVSKFTFISHHLFIIFYGSSNIFKAIFEGSFP